jgi:hypothetical protein
MLRKMAADSKSRRPKIPNNFRDRGNKKTESDSVRAVSRTFR